jgi:transposase
MHHHFNHTTKGRKIMRKSAVQISLWDTYNGVSEAIEQHKPELIRLLEEHIDFDRIIPVSFKLAFYRYMGRKHKYHLESFIRAFVVQKLLGITRPTGKLKEAVTYALNQKEFLCAFLDHGEIEISNNQVENAIRPFVVGRKGWLFSDTPDGAEATAIVYTLMETAKANNLQLEDYIEHLLTVLPERLADDPDADIDDLLPWADGMQKSFAMIRTGA